MIALLAVARAIHFASLMVIFGGSTYGLLLQRGGLPEPPFRTARLLFGIAATLALASEIVWFGLIAGQMSGDSRDSLDPATLELMASATRFGHIFSGRLVGLVALCLLCLFKVPRGLALSILAGLLLVSLAPVSHAGATGGEPAVLGSANDAAHLLAAAFWVGGLMILALMLPQTWSAPRSLLGPLRVFSRWGTRLVALLVITGLINAVSIVPLSAVTFRNTYFALLFVKVGLALAMIGLAALNRWRFAPALRLNEPEAVRPLARSVGMELALGIVIVAIVGYLGLIAPH